MISPIPDKGRVMVRNNGLDANTHWGKVKKASPSSFALRLVKEDIRGFPSKGWAEMIRRSTGSTRWPALSVAALQYSKSSVSGSMSVTEGLLVRTCSMRSFRGY